LGTIAWAKTAFNAKVAMEVFLLRHGRLSLRRADPSKHSNLKTEFFMQRSGYGIVLVLACGSVLSAWTFMAGADDEKSATKAGDKAAATQKNVVEKKPVAKKVAMKLFMRKKLEASQHLLEGLAVEDFDMIATGARQLKTTSAAAEFIVVNDPMYAQQADEFRRIVDKLEKAAKEKRLDGATLGYVDMTMSCVECHKYVRNVLLANK
jgi:hypothetical protein